LLRDYPLKLDLENLKPTRRQSEVLALVCRGQRNSEIAAELKISVRTVKWHIGILLETFHASNRTQLVAIVSNRTLNDQTCPSVQLQFKPDHNILDPQSD
jgi:DNA-binding NarL/FixJ family response regulator